VVDLAGLEQDGAEVRVLGDQHRRAGVVPAELHEPGERDRVGGAVVGGEVLP